ncbi:hypothetical protein L2E82_04354 [Cichorium intybus]|uniref:Uncharacterized protein n=1 Tax=Cichorium intybus TaxID=13427 RepID=A0ACB9H6I2_CICIN|nr:hypothetical protein L2E82_04354 [Cichorium intybus]
MAATTTLNYGKSIESAILKPPVHPTYHLNGVIKLALSEDSGDKGDVTCLANIPTEMEVEAYFLAKDDGIIAGISLAEIIFNEVDPTLKAMAEAASPACILETRKTAPALRLVDKWMVLIGGGKNHKMGLFDMVMIKYNHISIYVETRTFEEIHEVLSYASENKMCLSRVMLDNMVVPQGLKVMEMLTCQC